MKITETTTPQEVAAKTKEVMRQENMPNMRMQNAGNPDGFVSEEKDYQFWLQRVCGKQE